MVDRTGKLFPKVPVQLPATSRPLFDPTLLVDAPYTMVLAPDSVEVGLIDLLRWVDLTHGISQENVSALAYTLFFRLIGVDGLIDAATPEQWVQLAKEIKAHLNV